MFEVVQKKKEEENASGKEKAADKGNYSVVMDKCPSEDMKERRQSLIQEMNDKVNELNFDDDHSPINDEFGILSELKRLRFDESSLSDNSPNDFLAKVKSPITPNKDESGLPMEYMWKGEGQINTKFYPPKRKVCKDDSNSNTPDSRLNFSTFTTYLENNPMLRYFDNTSKKDGDTPKIDISRLARPELYIKRSDQEVTFREKVTEEEEIEKEKEKIQKKSGSSNTQPIITNCENVNNAYINMNVNMNVLNNPSAHSYSPPTQMNRKAKSKSINPQTDNYLNYSPNNLYSCSPYSEEYFDDDLVPNYIYNKLPHFNMSNTSTPNNELYSTNAPDYSNDYYYEANNMGGNMNNNNMSTSNSNSMMSNMSNQYKNNMQMNMSNMQSMNNYRDNYNPMKGFTNNNSNNNSNNRNYQHNNHMYGNKMNMMNMQNMNTYNNNPYFQMNYGNNLNMNMNMNNFAMGMGQHGINMGGSHFNNLNSNNNTLFVNNSKRRGDMADFGGRELKINKVTKTPLLSFMNMDNEELARHSYNLAKDQAGCRYLQKKIEEEPEIVNLIYPRIVEYTIELMNDAFGNYLIQKILEYIPDDKLYQILAIINPHLLSLGMNPHGTRVVQKLIENLTTEELVNCFIKILKPNVLNLIKDMNGNHIVQKFINQIDENYTKFIYEIINENIIDISTHKHGCCVLQKCIENSKPEAKIFMVENLISYSLTLILDQYGNYVVQYILAMHNMEYNRKIIMGLLKDICYLSKQKYSSNVVEKCFDCCDEETRENLINSLLTSEIISDLLLDMYGNYVVQKALFVSKPEDQQFILNIIAPLMEKLRFFNFGPKLYNKLIITYPQLSSLMFQLNNDDKPISFSPNQTISQGDCNQMPDINYQRMMMTSNKSNFYQANNMQNINNMNINQMTNMNNMSLSPNQNMQHMSNLNPPNYTLNGKFYK